MHLYKTQENAENILTNGVAGGIIIKLIDEA